MQTLPNIVPLVTAPARFLLPFVVLANSFWFQRYQTPRASDTGCETYSVTRFELRRTPKLHSASVASRNEDSG